MKEIWKDIKGYEGLYQVSNLGRVMSFKTNKLLIGGNNRGYKTKILRKENKSAILYVHRLVAQAFIPNPENKPFINHKDGNKLNNCVDNLEWVTQKENIQHAWKNGLCKHKVNKVAQIKDGKIINIYDNCEIASKYINGVSSCIYKCVDKNYYSKTYRGYQWEYLKNVKK